MKLHMKRHRGKKVIHVEKREKYRRESWGKKHKWRGKRERKIRHRWCCATTKRWTAGGKAAGKCWASLCFFLFVWLFHYFFLVGVGGGGLSLLMSQGKAIKVKVDMINLMYKGSFTSMTPASKIDIDVTLLSSYWRNKCHLLSLRNVMSPDWLVVVKDLH